MCWFITENWWKKLMVSRLEIDLGGIYSYLVALLYTRCWAVFWVMEAER